MEYHSTILERKTNIPKEEAKIYQRIYIPAKLKIKKTYGKIISQMQGRTKRWAKRRRKPKID